MSNPLYIKKIDELFLLDWYKTRVELNPKLKIALKTLYIDYVNYCSGLEAGYSYLGRNQFSYHFWSILRTDSEKPNVIKGKGRDGIYFFGISLKETEYSRSSELVHSSVK
jgi:hypothetical protein